MASRVFYRTSGVAGHLLRAAAARREPLMTLSNGLHSLGTASPIKWGPHQTNQLLSHSKLTNATLQRFGFSSTASPQPTDKEANHVIASEDASEVGRDPESAKQSADSETPERTPESGLPSEPNKSKSKSPRIKKRRRTAKRTAFSDSDAEGDLSFDDLVKLVAEKEELLKLIHKENETMKDKVLRTYADMENVIARTKREAENSKKFAIQNFAKSLLDVADNLGRASSVVKESFSKIDASKDSVGAVPLVKTLLEGVEMTEKQLAEVLKKFGVEKFDPLNEHFDPNRHHALFQIPDASKPPGTVAAVLKPGYMLHDRIIRPAEVGVTEGSNEDGAPSSDA